MTNAHVLVRRPGDSDWTWAEFPIGDDGFSVKVLQQMGGGEYFERIKLGHEFALICDEEGRLAKKPVCIRLGMEDGTVNDIFGQIAIVRVADHVDVSDADLGEVQIFVGLNKPEDKAVILSTFPWRSP